MKSLFGCFVSGLIVFLFRAWNGLGVHTETRRFNSVNICCISPPDFFCSEFDDKKHSPLVTCKTKWNDLAKTFFQRISF